VIQNKKYDDTLSLKIDKNIKIEIHSKIKLDLRKNDFRKFTYLSIKDIEK
jgi:hypothetical protein